MLNAAQKLMLSILLVAGFLLGLTTLGVVVRWLAGSSMQSTISVLWNLRITYAGYLAAIILGVWGGLMIVGRKK